MKSPVLFPSRLAALPARLKRTVPPLVSAGAVQLTKNCVVAASVLLMALWLARKGYVQRATAMMLGTLTLSVSYLSFLNQGIDGPGVTGYSPARHDKDP